MRAFLLYSIIHNCVYSSSFQIEHNNHEIHRKEITQGAVRGRDSRRFSHLKANSLEFLDSHCRKQDSLSLTSTCQQYVLGKDSKMIMEKSELDPEEIELAKENWCENPANKCLQSQTKRKEASFKKATAWWCQTKEGQDSLFCEEYSRLAKQNLKRKQDAVQIKMGEPGIPQLSKAIKELEKESSKQKMSNFFFFQKYMKTSHPDHVKLITAMTQWCQQIAPTDNSGICELPSLL